MSRIKRPFASALVVAGSIAGSLLPGIARAQTVTPAQSGLTNRLDANGNDITSQERPQNLNPTGISFNDCITNMSIGFPIVLSGFAGQGLEVWVGSQDCSTDVARGKMGTPPVCWKVAEVGAMNASTNVSTQINVRMQNIVGPQAAPPATGVLVNETSSACYAQPSYASVQFNVAFVPVNSAGLLSGTGASFTVNTDLVGPPAPSGVSSNTGDTLFIVNWTPNVDPDTAGYDVYIGSVAQLTSGASAGDGGFTKVCTEAGTSSSGGSSSGGVADGSIDDSAVLDGAIIDATVADSSSSGGSSSSGVSSSSGSTTPACTNVVNTPAPGCGGTIFSQSFVSDGGGTVTVPVSDDAGDDATTTVAAIGGGISQIPTKYLVNANGTTTVTVSSSTVGSYNVTGLTNNVPYAAVVAAVDGFGNIGPPSAQICDMPQPVNDFYKIYRMDGGGSSTSFCTLEAVGAPTGASIIGTIFGALGFGLFRRRRRR